MTALVVQRIYGGGILKTATAGGAHFYNRINGMRWDFTAGQFAEPITYQDEPSTAAEALSDTSSEQVAALLQVLGWSEVDDRQSR